MIPTRARHTGAFVLRKAQSALAAFQLIGDGAAGSAIRRPSLLMTIVVVLLLVLVPMLLLPFLVLGKAAGLTLATAAVALPAKKPANIRQMEQDFKALAKELEIGQTEMANGPISQARGEELEQKAKEMETLQAHLDQYNRVAGIVRASKTVDSPTLPTDQRGQVKRIMTTPGHQFVTSEAFRQYKQGGKFGQSAWVPVAGQLGRRVVLKGEDAVAYVANFNALPETKAFSDAQLSALGTDAIVEIDRDRDIVRFEEPEQLTIRSVINVTPTTSDTVRYVKLTAVDRAAASQPSRGALKNYLKVTYEAVNATVETIAVLSKVTEQDIDDAPRLVDAINGEMRLDVRQEEERQIVWGSGANGQLRGLFVGNDIPEFDRATGDDTVIDIIRKMITDLRIRHVTPSFALVDPIDWESVELTKGSDDRYVWAMITDLRGPRIWSVRVVDTDAMTNPDTGHRRILVGDGVRGATIYDRNDIRLNIGFVDDDFARNLRTLRCEERLALAVKRPWAFEYAVTSGPSGTES